jgi:hypothetical protein
MSQQTTFEHVRKTLDDIKTLQRSIRHTLSDIQLALDRIGTKADLRKSILINAVVFGVICGVLAVSAYVGALPKP